MARAKVSNELINYIIGGNKGGSSGLQGQERHRG